MQTEKKNIYKTVDAFSENSKSKTKEIMVSIIVPIYNMEQYLEKCVRSILAQTYDHFEVILIDDGSKDASYNIAQKLAGENSRINVIHKKNEGVSVARNTGMKAAKGSWIMFVDPDDTLEPSLVQELLYYADDDVDIIACCCNVIFEDTQQVDYFFASDRNFVDRKEKNDLYKQLMNASYGQPGKMFTAIGVPWGKLYRTSFLQEKNLNFNPRLKRYQDNIFNMYAFFYAQDIVYLNQPLYNYREEHISNYKQNYKPGFCEYMSALCEERYTCLKNLGLFEDDELQNFFRREMLSRIFQILHEDIFSPYNEEPFREKAERTKNLCEKECFDPLIHGSREGFTRRQRLQLRLMKRRHFRLLCVLVSRGQTRRRAN